MATIRTTQPPPAQNRSAEARAPAAPDSVAELQRKVDSVLRGKYQAPNAPAKKEAPRVPPTPPGATLPKPPSQRTPAPAPAPRKPAVTATPPTAERQLVDTPLVNPNPRVRPQAVLAEHAPPEQAWLRSPNPPEAADPVPIVSLAEPHGSTVVKSPAWSLVALWLGSVLLPVLAFAFLFLGHAAMDRADARTDLAQAWWLAAIVAGATSLVGFAHPRRSVVGLRVILAVASSVPAGFLLFEVAQEYGPEVCGGLFFRSCSTPGHSLYWASAVLFVACAVLLGLIAALGAIFRRFTIVKRSLGGLSVGLGVAAAVIAAVLFFTIEQQTAYSYRAYHPKAPAAGIWMVLAAFGLAAWLRRRG